MSSDRPEQPLIAKWLEEAEMFRSQPHDYGCVSVAATLQRCAMELQEEKDEDRCGGCVQLRGARIHTEHHVFVEKQPAPAPADLPTVSSKTYAPLPWTADQFGCYVLDAEGGMGLPDSRMGTPHRTRRRPGAG